MMREPRHGELMSATQKEAYSIWLTRNNELDICDKHGMMSDYVSEPDDEANKDYAKKFWGLLETLTPRERHVISLRYSFDMTLSEVGECFTLTSERIRQIEKKAMRKLMHPDRIGTLGRIPEKWSLAQGEIACKAPTYAWSEWL